MGVYGPLRGALFIAEFFRFLILIGVCVVLQPFGDAGAYQAFPYAVYVVPHGLFLLMTYFLWIRLSEYKPYIALYMAGKTIGVVSVVGWLVFFVPAAAADFALAKESTAVLVGGMSVVAALDGLTVGGCALLNTKLKAQSRREPEGSNYGG